MRRRDLVAALGGLAVASPLASRAQQKATPLLCVLLSGAQSAPFVQSSLKAFQVGLDALGWIEGRNIRIEYRWAANEESNFKRYAAELVALKPDVILASGTSAATALKKTATTIPIVCALVQDPVRLGFAASLAQPGGNMTGFTYINPEIIGKWRDLLVQAAPSTTRAALLFNPTINSQYYDYLRDMGPARSSVIDIVPTPVTTVDALQAAMVELGRGEGASVIIGPESFVLANVQQVVALALQYRMPTIAVYRQFAFDGGLMSYGPDVPEIYRNSASYVDRILRGANPAELPVQQPDKFEFAINLKTAKALGLSIPLTLLALADQMIE
jgi:putative ABC transport system substrate-binding protein